MKLFKAHRKMAVAGLALTVALFAGGVAFAYWTSSGTGAGAAQTGQSTPLLIDQLGGTPMYNSTVDENAYQASQCYYCVQMGDFGNKINLANGGGPLSDVVVAMANFNAASGPMNVTLNVYNPGSYSGPGTAPGSLIATDKQTFTIPAGPNGGYGSTYCTTTGASDPTCGIANFDITFNFSSQNITLPGQIVYGIQYNDPQTSITGGVNVQLVSEPTQVSVGSDADPGYLFTSLAATANGDGYNNSGNDVGPGEVTCQNVTTTFGEYSTASCNGGTQGYGTPPYVPAVEFDTSSMSDLYPGGPPQTINFSITNPGTIPQTVNSVLVGIATDSGNGYVEAIPGQTASDDAGCVASWFTISPSPVNVSATIPAGGTVDWLGQASISMPADAVDNQNACQNKTIGLTFASS